MDDPLDQHGNAGCHIIENLFRRFARRAQGNADEDSPGEDADVVCIQQCPYRIIDDIDQQRADDGNDAARRIDL